MSLQARLNQTKVVKPYWLAPAIANLSKSSKPLLDENWLWSANSGKLFYLNAKLDVEALRLANGGAVGGHEWWLIQDIWTGSNGVLDSFLAPKPGISDDGGARLRKILGPLVLLLSTVQGKDASETMDRATLPLSLRGGETLNATIWLSNYGDVRAGTKLRWDVTVGGDAVGMQTLVVEAPPRGTATALTSIAVTMPQMGSFPGGPTPPKQPQTVLVSAQLLAPDGHVLTENDWTSRLYPEWADGPSVAPRWNFTLFTTADLFNYCMFNDAELIPNDPSMVKDPSGAVLLLRESGISRSAMALVNAGATAVIVQVRVL
eukprot:SAG11_NODE_2165_length_3728_cov_2.060072_4_plen_318_part_00